MSKLPLARLKLTVESNGQTHQDHFLFLLSPYLATHAMAATKDLMDALQLTLTAPGE
ncbi:hypothetical protein LguiA_014984 [Lonicera macranthoides]